MLSRSAEVDDVVQIKGGLRQTDPSGRLPRRGMLAHALPDVVVARPDDRLNLVDLLGPVGRVVVVNPSSVGVGVTGTRKFGHDGFLQWLTCTPWTAGGTRGRERGFGVCGAVC